MERTVLTGNHLKNKCIDVIAITNISNEVKETVKFDFHRPNGVHKTTLIDEFDIKN